MAMGEYVTSGKVFYNPEYNVWHIKGSGLSFWNVKDAKKYKVLTLEINKLQRQITQLKIKLPKTI